MKITKSSQNKTGKCNRLVNNDQTVARGSSLGNLFFSLSSIVGTGYSVFCCGGISLSCGRTHQAFCPYLMNNCAVESHIDKVTYCF